MHVILEIIFGVLIAELAAAVFHWVEDTYISYCSTNPIFKYIAKNNELHHYYPRAILAYPWYLTVSDTFVLAIAVTFIVWLLNANAISKYPIFWLSAIIWGTLTAMTHKLSHCRYCEVPTWYANLQKCNILSGHEHHGKHHENSDNRYAVSFPIINTILDTLDVFRFLEKCIYALTGVSPQRKPGYQEYPSLRTEIHYETENTSCPRVITQDERDKLSDALNEMYRCSKEFSWKGFKHILNTC